MTVSHSSGDDQWMDGPAAEAGERRQSRRRERDLRRPSETDPLTGLRNDRYLARILTGNRHRRDRRRRSFCCLMEADGLEQLAGAQGDEVLRRWAREVEKAAQDCGVAARWLGDTLVVIRNCSDDLEAWLWGERMRSVAAASAGLSISVGIACVETDQLSMRTLELAEHALTMAQASGGGRVCTWEMVEVESAAAELQMHGDLSVEARRLSLLHRLDARLGPGQRQHAGRHCEDVAAMAARLASGLGLESRWVESVRLAGLLHDVGKCVIPEALLSKPAGLTVREWSLLRRHGEFGAHVASVLGASDDVIDIIERHHDMVSSASLARMAEVSPVVQCARVLSLADAMCAMRANRPYRPGMGRTEVLRSLGSTGAGGLEPPLAAVVERVSVEAWTPPAA